jgi:hypothetical protein
LLLLHNGISKRLQPHLHLIKVADCKIDLLGLTLYFFLVNNLIAETSQLRKVEFMLQSSLELRYLGRVGLMLIFSVVRVVAAVVR